MFVTEKFSESDLESIPSLDDKFEPFSDCVKLLKNEDTLAAAMLALIDWPMLFVTVLSAADRLFNDNDCDANLAR